MIKHNSITDIAIRIEDYFSDEIGYLSEDAWCDMQDNLKMIIENWLSENNIQFEQEN
jgi:hypothetical protein